MKFKLQLTGEESIPKGYGYSYSRLDNMLIVFYPIPLNYLIRIGRDLYFWFIRGKYSTDQKKIRLMQSYEAEIEAILSLMYQKGWDRESATEDLKAYEDRIKQMIYGDDNSKES